MLQKYYDRLDKICSKMDEGDQWDSKIRQDFNGVLNKIENENIEDPELIEKLFSNILDPYEI